MACCKSGRYIVPEFEGMREDLLGDSNDGVVVATWVPFEDR
jgi:hypothetical protein